MNKLTKLSITAFLLMFVFMPFTNTQAQIGIKSVGVDAGWYIPSLSFWNEDSFIQNWDDQFGGGVYGKGFLEVSLVDPVSARIGVGYWTQTREQTGIVWGNETRTDEIQLTLIPVTMDVIADLKLEDLKPVSLYGGIGWGVNFIQMKYTRTPSVSAEVVDDHSGRDYIGYLLAGVNIPIASGFAAAVEARYVFGQYVQELYNATGTKMYGYDVTLGGPQITLALKYMFDE